MSFGTVYLVGAGPGDLGLVTLAAQRAIQSADVILYDGLCNEAILQWAPPHCVLQCVGKRGHGGHWSQAQIDDLIVQHAREHRQVVRLKGGDTSVFARTTEEIERLEAEGIPYRIVPGLTVALAASAYTGIPITHRDWSSSVALITAQLQSSDGHDDAEEPLDWSALACFPGTLIFYMGLRNAPVWSQQLIAHGKSPATPVALIRRCSWSDQQVLRCDLANVAETLSKHPEFRSPAIGIVGDVVRAASLRNWFTSQPLFGQTWVVTSPSEQAIKLEACIRSQGGEVLAAPAIEVVPPSDWAEVDALIARLRSIDWIVFSSQAGVRSLMNRLLQLGYDARQLGNTSIAAVGQATAESLRTFGLGCDLLPEHGAGAEALRDRLMHAVAGRSVALISHPDGRTLLEGSCREVAREVVVVHAYATHAAAAFSENVLELSRQCNQDRSRNVWWTATSSNIAKHAVQCLGEDAKALQWISIAPAVTDTLHALGCQRVVTSPDASYASMVQAVMEMVRDSEASAGSSQES
ncbi:MAG: uroporphyrinogen-III C-methyltransferase [Pirellula sp.]